MRASLDMLHKILVPWMPKSATVSKGVTQSVSALLWRRAQQQSQQNEESKDKEGSTVNGPDVAFLDSMEYARLLWTRVEESGWLDHARNVISSSVLVAETLSARKCSVLVHCSDGWDRTAQVCATSQIILDPYFRTLEGLCVLIEKDWCGFGHKFHDRIGHMRPSNGEDGKEVSPVFLQVFFSYV